MESNPNKQKLAEVKALSEFFVLFFFMVFPWLKVPVDIMSTKI